MFTCIQIRYQIDYIPDEIFNLLISSNSKLKQTKSHFVLFVTTIFFLVENVTFVIYFFTANFWSLVTNSKCKHMAYCSDRENADTRNPNVRDSKYLLRTGVIVLQESVA